MEVGMSMLMIAIFFALIVSVCIQLSSKEIVNMSNTKKRSRLIKKQLDFSKCKSSIDETGKEKGSANSPLNEGKELYAYVDEIKKMSTGSESKIIY